MIYEVQFGVFVEADNESIAFENVRNVMQDLEAIDVEGDPVAEIVNTYTDEQFGNLGR